MDSPADADGGGGGSSSSGGSGGGPAPAYCMLDLAHLGDDAIKYAFMYNGSRFYTTVSADGLRGPGRLLGQFEAFKHDLDDLDVMFQFEDWVLGALDGFISRLAPAPPPPQKKKSRPSAAAAATLLDCFSCPTYAFELVNRGGKLCAVQEAYDALKHGDSSPRTRIVDALPPPGPSGAAADDDISLGLDHGNPPPPASSRSYYSPLNGGAILRSALPPVPHILASELERVDDGGQSLDEELGDGPSKVRRVGSSSSSSSPSPSSSSSSSVFFFFKAGFRDPGHLREIELLSRISRLGDKFPPPFRTSRVAGLVVWDDDQECLMGFLLEYIEGRTLAWRVQQDGGAGAEEKRRWLGQVEATLRRLHEAGIVWGDAKPDNVMINAEGDAVVVDFGGGYAPEYISVEDQLTMRGDLIGLEHMRTFLGV